MVTTLILGSASAVAAVMVWREFVASDQLLLIAGLAENSVCLVLWVIASACAIVFAVAGFRVFVFGYEPITAMLAAVALVVVPLVSVGMTLGSAFGALFTVDATYVVLGALDRPTGRQVVVSEFSPIHDTYWHVYVGGPFVYADVTSETLLDDDCPRPGGNGKPRPIANGEHRLTTDEQGRDILTIPVDQPHCNNAGVFEFALPD